MSIGTPGFLPYKLSKARRLRRKNMTALAKDIGMSRASISAYEKGKKTPSPETMGDICQALDMPLQFFLSRSIDQSDSSGPIFYRSYASATKIARESANEKHKIISEIVDYLEKFIDFPINNIPDFNVPSDPCVLTDKDIIRISQKTRKYWGLTLGPISDVVCLLENNGIVVGKFPFECEKIDAFSQRLNNQFQIIIGSDKSSSVRQRFDAAHELGHIILHKNVPKDLLKDKGIHMLIEKQADLFSSEFLFPQEAFESEAKRFTLSEFTRLKMKWKISIGAQIFKTSRMDFATNDLIKPLWRSYSRRGWRKNEPCDGELVCEEPRLIKDGLQLVLESKTQKPSDIFDQFGMNFSDLEEILGLDSGYFSSFSEYQPAVRLKPRFAKESTEQLCDAEPTKESNVISFLDAFAQRKQE